MEPFFGVGELLIGSCRAPHCPRGAPLILSGRLDDEVFELKKSGEMELVVVLLEVPFPLVLVVVAEGVSKDRDAKSSKTEEALASC